MRRSEANPGKRVLVLGDYRQTVTVVRSLARAGCRVILGTDDPNSSTARSRYLWDVWVYEGACPKRFRDDLEAWLRRERAVELLGSSVPRITRQPARARERTTVTVCR